MRVLVTGAAGFIGQHVCRAVSEAGHSILAIDLRKPRIGEWLEADITQPLEPVPNLDAVIHLAAIASPNACDAHPAEAFNVNVNGTHQVLKMAWASGAKKVVFASTAHVYGISPRYLPTPEGHPLWLQNTYTLTKILGEQLCQLYYDNHDLSYIALRLYNAYGPGQEQGYFIPDMLQKVRKGPVTLQGARTTKDFVYIDDVADAFVSALTNPFVGAINIGTGKETKLAEVASFILQQHSTECVGCEGFDLKTPGTRMCANNTRAAQVLGWHPKVTVWEGLRAVVNESRPVPA